MRLFIFHNHVILVSGALADPAITECEAEMDGMPIHHKMGSIHLFLNAGFIFSPI